MSAMASDELSKRLEAIKKQYNKEYALLTKNFFREIAVFQRAAEKAKTADIRSRIKDATTK